MASGRNNIIMVIPVPSGVIIADRIKKNKNAYLHFFLQKSAFIIPIKLNKNMFGLGLLEIVIILVVAAVLFFIYWGTRKNKVGTKKDIK